MPQKDSPQSSKSSCTTLEEADDVYQKIQQFNEERTEIFGRKEMLAAGKYLPIKKFCVCYLRMVKIRKELGKA